MTITKAVIPVAGWGTRRLPITKTIEKCMLPVGNRPLVDYVVQDCIAAGIHDIYFVVSEDSTQLQSYYGRNTTLETYLQRNGKADRIPEIMPPAEVSFHYILQDSLGKYGTTIPVSLAAVRVDPGESLVVLMGDDFIYNKDGSGEVRRLIDATPEGECSMLGVEIDRDLVSRYGVLEFNERHHFMRIVEKPTPEAAPSSMINVSKYVLNHQVLQKIIMHAQSDREGEYQITEPINDYVAQGGIVKIVPAKGQYLDGGTVDGWLQANRTVLGDIA